MAFSIRKMFNIGYFKKSEAQEKCDDQIQEDTLEPLQAVTGDDFTDISIENYEPDSTTINCATSLKLPCSIKNYAAKKGSHSDTDLIRINLDSKLNKKQKRSKNLKLDIEKANKSMSEALNIKTNETTTIVIENTPKHISLGCKSSDAFCERIKGFDFNASFDLFDAMSEGRPSTPDVTENLEIESMSLHSGSELSLASESLDKTDIKMCRKVEAVSHSSTTLNAELPRSVTPESFGDVELDNTEDERINLLLTYQMKLEKLERVLKKMLNEFQFHIQVSKVLVSKSLVTTLPNTDVNSLQMTDLGELTYVETVSRGPSPSGWNLIVEKEDLTSKFKIRNQLLLIQSDIKKFVDTNLVCQAKVKPDGDNICKPETRDKIKRKNTKNIKKKIRRQNDFPDYSDALKFLFDYAESKTVIESKIEDCNCICHCHSTTSQSQTDSGLHAKIEDHSISSSIGNFSLDSNTLTAYSESLDQIISYNSFQDTSLYSSVLQKTAIERITFYIQVHNIQLKCEKVDMDFESKNQIIFYCQCCKSSIDDEQGLVKHILSQYHCEKIHFQYKTAYIKKCVQTGKEIQPSTVLNPMTMYRDDNKIVCFGDAVYACSLCFENLLVGESVLMAHCYEEEHLEKRDMLYDFLQ